MSTTSTFVLNVSTADLGSNPARPHHNGCTQRLALDRGDLPQLDAAFTGERAWKLKLREATWMRLAGATRSCSIARRIPREWLEPFAWTVLEAPRWTQETVSRRPLDDTLPDLRSSWPSPR